MSEKQPSSLIGYDPLAWLNDVEPETESLPVEALSDNAELPTKTTEPSASIDSGEHAGIDADEEDQLDVIHANKNASESELDNLSDGLVDNVISLQSVVNIQQVRELHQQLLNALENNKKIEIDASEVTNIDTASLQLLLVLKTTAIIQQKEIVFDFPSERFIDSARLLGIDGLLDIDQAAAGFF